MSTALLTRTESRDSAFERLYRRHVHEVYRYVLAVLRNQADAEDVTQTTFLNAYRAFTRGEEPQKPRNWLLKIAHNECRQRFRASARRPKEVEWDDRAPAPAVDETVPTADEIRNALTHLSFNQRSALVMRELEGRSYAEIAAILDLSVSAVETVLFRARRALREQLEGALTCGEAEATLSRRLDGRLAAAEQRALRAHLRECPECALLERKQRARRSAVKRLGVVQLPPSLASFLGGGGAVSGGTGLAIGTGVVAKAAAVVTAGVVAGGVGHQAVQAVAADKPVRTPVRELAQASKSSSASPGRSPGTAPVVAGVVGRVITVPTPAPRVRNRVQNSLRARPPARSTAPPPAAAAPIAAPAAAQPPAAVRPPVSTQPVRRTVGRAVGTVETIVKTVLPPQPPPAPASPPPPPPPLELPQLPPVPPLPPLPPLLP
jgi:RNA polymerase sigma factor (sigma-70 family)